ncbi:MAG: hypothetical protein QMD10_12825 [Desulfitobacteriaceae bacterium]|nr:hypothetical protein [Desulfitobacteriaceae bacterium]
MYCIYCSKPIEWGVICNEFDDLLDQVDQWGVDSLTEQEQLVYEGKLCIDCYYKGKGL